MPVPQDARLAMNVIEPLGKLKEQLADPASLSAGVTASLDIGKLNQEITAVTQTLNQLVSLASGGNPQAAQEELAQEAELRRESQKERHQRSANCEDEGGKPEDTPGRRPRIPQTGRRMPQMGQRIPQAMPRLPSR